MMEGPSHQHLHQERLEPLEERGTPLRTSPAKPANWPTMTKTQRIHWYKREGEKWHWTQLWLTSVHENRPKDDD